MPEPNPSTGKRPRKAKRPPFERIALLLQGGGALVEHAQRLRQAVHRLLAMVPDQDAVAADPEFRIQEGADEKVYTIVHLIYRAKRYEGSCKAYEFSRETTEQHWAAGYDDAVRTLRHPKVLKRPDTPDGVATFDVA